VVVAKQHKRSSAIPSSQDSCLRLGVAADQSNDQHTILHVLNNCGLGMRTAVALVATILQDSSQQVMVACLCRQCPSFTLQAEDPQHRGDCCGPGSRQEWTYAQVGSPQLERTAGLYAPATPTMAAAAVAARACSTCSCRAQGPQQWIALLCCSCSCHMHSMCNTSLCHQPVSVLWCCQLQAWVEEHTRANAGCLHDEVL
jgi:hypothetical protein